MSCSIGLVGCGRWGRNILRDLRKLGCDVHICDSDAIAREVALNEGASSACSSIDSLPEALMGFIVATPTVNHFDMVYDLLPRQKPIFCEKPLTSDFPSAQKLVEIDNNQIFLMDKWRYHPGVQALADLVSQGELGVAQQIRTRRVQWGHPHSDVDGVWILLPHDLAIVHHILGYMPEPQSAIADYSAGNMDGLLAILGNQEQTKAIIEVSSRQPKSDRLISVSFEKGVAWLADPLDDHICVYNKIPGTEIDPDTYEKIPISTDWPLWLELKGFVEYLNGGSEPLTNAELATQHVELIEQLRLMAGAN